MTSAVPYALPVCGLVLSWGLVARAQGEAPSEPAADAPPVPAATADPVVDRIGVRLVYRPRIEKTIFGNLQARPANGDFQITHRARLGLSGETVIPGVDVPLRANVVLQDVRTWASETHTGRDFSADGLDLHEGWVEFGGGWPWPDLRVGRQEVLLDEQRLIGISNWSQAGRSFDALRLHLAPEHFDLALLVARVPDGGTHELFAFTPAATFADITLSTPVIYQTNAMVASPLRGDRPDDWHKVTAGAHARGTHGDWSWRAEGYVQAGNDALAFMAGGRVSYKISRYFTPTLWFDFLSGDDPDTDLKNESFDTLFGASHAYYGLFDRFSNIDADTFGGGLLDSALKSKSELPKGFGELKAELHLFAFARPTADDRAGLMAFEGDLVYAVELFDPMLELEVGAAWFQDLGDFARDRNRTFHDWYYLQLSFDLDVPIYRGVRD